MQYLSPKAGLQVNISLVYIPFCTILFIYCNVLDIPRLPDLFSDIESQSHDEIEVEEDNIINEGKDSGKIVQHTRNPSGPRAPDPQDVNSMKLMPIFGALIAFFGALLLLCRL